MEIVCFVAGVAVTAIVAYFIASGKLAAAAARLEAERSSRAGEKDEFEKRLAEEKDASEKRLAEEKDASDKRLAEERQGSEKRLAEEKDASEKRLAEEKDTCERRLAEEKDAAEKRLAEEKDACERRLAEASRQAREQRDSDIAALRKSYDDQLALFREQVFAATDRLLKERGGELQLDNSRRMDELFRPIREDMTRMERAMNEQREAAARSNASFEKTIQLMVESNERLGGQADRLSTALQRQNKTAGNWGELILSELLESQGLKPGVHFDVQQTLRDESGRATRNDDTGSRMIPDVVLHLADNRDVVIDSKVSLTAYIDYQNAATEAERRDALERHLISMRNHISELSAKRYSDYISKSRSSIDFVIMFVPVEGALQLALSERPSLWREAFDKRVFISGGQTLIAALRIIDLTWVSVLQERNTAKVMDEARKLINRVGEFYKEFQTVGRRLEEAAKAYSDVSKRVSEGSQSILSTGRRMESMGVRGKNALPAGESDDAPLLPLDS